MRNLFILRGAPGSGKSTWIKQNNLEEYTLSTDNLRLMYQSPVTDIDGNRIISQNNDHKVWRLLFELLEKRMENGEFIIIDATHYKSSMISRYKDLVSKYRYRVNVVDFSTVPEEECLKRNAQREEFKRVPEDVIQKMYACLHDDTEVKKAYKIITPEEAAKLVNSELEPVIIDDKYNGIVVFGDIHGCYTPLEKWFKDHPFRDDIVYIFCGDYIDRGLQNKEVLQFLLGIFEKPNIFLLEGNHEKWLRLWCSKDYKETDKMKFNYLDLYVEKYINQLSDKLTQLKGKIEHIEESKTELYSIFQESKKENPDNEIVFFEFEEVNAIEKFKEFSQLLNKYNNQIKMIERFITILDHEKNNTLTNLEECNTWYKENFNEGLSLNITNLIKEKFNMSENKVDNGIRSEEFLNNTLPQIKDMDKAKLRRLCDKFIQMSYFTFKGQTYLVTHAGLPCLPDMKTPTIELIKGVGKYEGTVECEKSFVKNVKDVIQIHGHRNLMQLPPVIDESWRNINLEGQVEFGGHLRVFSAAKTIDGGINKIIDQIKNDVYKRTEEKTSERKTDLEVLKEMLHSKLIQVKNLDDNIISLNFTKDAFFSRKWNDLTCKARGLFVDKKSGNICARSFEKFFNYKQCKLTEPDSLKENLKFPVIGYKKENGFLGIISKYNNKVRFFTKSTDNSDFTNYFIGVLCDNYNITMNNYTYTYHYLHNNIEFCKEMRDILAYKLNPLLTEGCSYVFECIDKDNDPHIIKYNSNNVYLLEVFKNQLKEEYVSYDELFNISCDLQVHLKKKELEFNNWEEFEEWKDKFRHGITQWDCKHEGYVFEDQNGFRVKFKSSFYSFWKDMRSIKESIQSGREIRKTYKTKQEIEVIKLMQSVGKEKLKNMSIIDIEDMFYERIKNV